MSRTVDPYSFGFLIADLARLVRLEFDRRVGASGIGITAAEARLLFHIARADGERQNVIADRMGVEAMTVSGLVDRLEARGLVVREVDQSDRRAKIVRLAEAAHEVLDSTRDLGNGIRDDARAGVAKEDWERMLVTMRAAHTNMLAMRAASCGREETTT